MFTLSPLRNIPLWLVHQSPERSMAVNKQTDTRLHVVTWQSWPLRKTTASAWPCSAVADDVRDRKRGGICAGILLDGEGAASGPRAHDRGPARGGEEDPHAVAVSAGSGSHASRVRHTAQRNIDTEAGQDLAGVQLPGVGVL